MVRYDDSSIARERNVTHIDNLIGVIVHAIATNVLCEDVILGDALLLSENAERNNASRVIRRNLFFRLLM